MEGLQYGLQQGYNPLLGVGFANPGYGSPLGQFTQQPQLGIQNPVGFQSQSPFGGLMGSGITGLLGAQTRQGGQVIDGITNLMSPYQSLDPVLQIQQAQLAQLAQQAQLAQMAQQAQLAQLIQQPQLAQALAQRTQFAPFGLSNPWLALQAMNRIDPVTAAYVQQAQIAQLCQQLAMQGQLGQPGFGQQIGLGQFGPAVGQSPWTSPHLGRGLGWQASPFQGAGFQNPSWQNLPIGAFGHGGQLPLY